MRQNLKQAIDVAVPFAFWTFIFSLIFGGIAGVILVIVESWGRFSGIIDFIEGALIAGMWGMYFAFWMFIIFGLITALVFGLATFIKPKYFRQLAYVMPVIILLILFVFFWLPLSPREEEANVMGLFYELYIHWATYIVLALSLFGAATRITLKHPTEKTKVKRKVKQQSVN